jgi:hypothetical protein
MANVISLDSTILGSVDPYEMSVTNHPRSVIEKYYSIRVHTDVQSDKDLLSLRYTVTRNYCKVKYHTVIH